MGWRCVGSGTTDSTARRSLPPTSGRPATGPTEPAAIVSASLGAALKKPSHALRREEEKLEGSDANGEQLG